jgi:hypothetical protein
MNKLANARQVSFLLIPVLLLSGCGKAPTNTLSPDLAGYSKEFQNHAANELTALKPPCARDVANEHCSAIYRLVIDYGDTRQQIRAINDI